MCDVMYSKKQLPTISFVGWCSVLLTSMLQSHHHRLLDKVPLDEATEFIPVHGEVR